ncbi:hypothetical protein HGRIS_003878 [Hohenbuehelia grisea]|uniref:Uncharacterized protein n=1 Tax=Hohenbuehelia grisea TaxID=104357 RepID=A0ABR3JHK6_9AGAR
MLPVANLHLKDLYDTTVEFFALRSPVAFAFRGQSPQDPRSRSLTPVPDPIARLTRECSSLRERLDAAERRQNTTCTCHPPQSDSPQNSSFPTMRRQLDIAKNELSQSRAEVARLEERCHALEKMVRDTQDLLRARDAEIEKLRREREHERGLVHRWRSEANLRHTLDSHSPPSSTSLPRSEHLMPSIYAAHRRDNSSSSVLSLASSEEERAHARALELFLTRTDTWSGAQIIQAVQDINSEILQFAASATEVCVFDRSAVSPRMAQAVQDTTSRLGPRLVHVLSTRDHGQDPLLVQLALQACVSACVARAMATFCLGWPSKADTVILQVYAYMYAIEPQPTSSRWRSLTHRHIHKLYPTLEEYGISELMETMLRWSADVFTVAGCTYSDAAATTALARDGMRARFGEQLRRIARSVSKLAQVTREEIMSANFDLVSVSHLETYDTKSMFDTFGEYAASRGAVLGTTELGLRCTTRRSASELGRDEGASDRRILLQPRVVLESVLDVIDPKP